MTKTHFPAHCFSLIAIVLGYNVLQTSSTLYASQHPFEINEIVERLQKDAGYNNLKTYQAVVCVNKHWNSLKDQTFFDEERDKATAIIIAHNIPLHTYKTGRQGLYLDHYKDHMTNRVFKALCSLHPTIQRVDMMGRHRVTDLSPITTLLHLRSLNIEGCTGIDNFNPLLDFYQTMKKLSLKKRKINTLRPLALFLKLEKLSVTTNAIVTEDDIDKLLQISPALHMDYDEEETVPDLELEAFLENDKSIEHTN